MKKIPILILLLVAQILTAIEIKEEIKESNLGYSYSFSPENSDKILEFSMGSEAIYPLVKSSDKNIEKNINSAITLIVDRLNAKLYITNKIKEYKNKKFLKVNHQSELNIELFFLFPKTFTLKIYEKFEFKKHDYEEENYFLNYDLFTGKQLTLNDFFIKGYETKIRTIIEKSYRQQYIKGDEDKYKDKLSWIKNNFIATRNLGFSQNGLVVEFFPKFERLPKGKENFAFTIMKIEENLVIMNASLEGENSFIVPYKVLESIIKKDGYLDLKR